MFEDAILDVDCCFIIVDVIVGLIESLFLEESLFGSMEKGIATWFFSCLA